ncbi:hypothetical protein GRX03_05825 [Halovenus sp. WSH3]|uniref:Uncharacterized protein n=1 Tax=Halovenus carboxidivorans TaxID=2692199 RepID=A0A6B0SZZ0_9EURY|nr:hypothetical protein [Halovenus carboxidivorans]MXR51125.1 hypothetical protein [Halovenus carboxidivorans]
MTRRAFLTGVGSSICFAFAGCLATDNNDDPSSKPADRREDEEFTPDVEPVTRLGKAPSISFEAAPERAYEYLEADDSVRIHYDSGETSTMSFDRWGTARAVDHGSDRLQSLFENKSLIGTGISIGQGQVELSNIEVSSGGEQPTQEEFKWGAPLAPIGFHSHHYARDGELISKPDVPFQRLVEEAPRSMEITMLFPEKEYTAVLPVVCDRTWSKDQ